MSIDPLNKEQRSERMSRIRSKDTKLEIIIRQFVYHSGFRYRIHIKELPGKPDIVFKSRKKVIFIHGCFWHQHGCKYYVMPKTRLDYWLPKLKNNADRDKANIEMLNNDGWEVLLLWECVIKHDITGTKNKILSFLMH